MRIFLNKISQTIFTVAYMKVLSKSIQASEKFSADSGDHSLLPYLK